MEDCDTYIAQYKKIHRIVDENIDIRGSALSLLIQICINDNGKLTKAVRDKYKLCAPDSYFDYIETVARSVLQPKN